nr:biotin transporter BioY [Shinella daejeonensis]
METAIRNALERSERASPEVRARIYQSARNALEAGLRKQQINDPETVAAQRHRLEAAIHRIEAEERAAAMAAPSRPAAGGAFPDLRPERADGFAAGGPPAGHAAVTGAAVTGAAATGTGTTGAGPADIRPERVVKARKRRSRVFSFLLVVATLIAGFGTAAWWVQSSGLLETRGGGAGSGATVDGQPYAGNGDGPRSLDTQNRFSSDWRPVFAAGDIAALAAGPRARVEPASANDRPAARLTSEVPGRDGAIRISVSPEILREMAGKASTVALSLRSPGEKPVEVSVECAFSTMGGCGRHRFTVTGRSDVLFKVEFEGSLSPSEPGQLLLNSDIAGDGASVDLYAVRILPGG